MLCLWYLYDKKYIYANRHILIAFLYLRGARSFDKASKITGAQRRATGESIIADSNHALFLLTRLHANGIHYGREDSFKLVTGQVLAERMLIGVDHADAAPAMLLDIAKDCGMPQAAFELLFSRVTEANAVFFGFEELETSCVCKVYLEFWEAVKREVRASGSCAPQLLHLGVKWNSAHPQRQEVARYECHPMLGVGAIMERMAACHGCPHGAPPISPLCKLTQDIVQRAYQRNRAASMLYLEVSEQGNPRSSYDINLYKSAITVNDCAAQLRRAGAYFSIAPELLEAQLERLGARPFGHISSGLDRHGHEFLSVYAETIAP